MNHIKDITGQKFGRLTAVSRFTCKRTDKTMWICQCECGNRVNVIMQNLKCGNTQSCGCKVIDLLRDRLQNDVTSHQNVQ